MFWLQDKNLVMLYFENQSEAPQITNLIPDKEYIFNWFDPVTGEWLPEPEIISTNEEGMISIDNFPDGEKVSTRDWSLKLLAKDLD